MRRETYLPVDNMSYDLLLIRAYDRNNTESSRVDLPTSIADGVDDSSLPATFTPQMSNVLHDALHDAKCAVILVIDDHGNEQLGLAGGDHSGPDGG